MARSRKHKVLIKERGWVWDHTDHTSGSKDYVESGFGKKDYFNLYNTTKNSFLKRVLRECKFRDKRIQRALYVNRRYLNNKSYKALTCPLKELPLFLGKNRGDESYSTDVSGDIAAWRLKIGR